MNLTRLLVVPALLAAQCSRPDPAAPPQSADVTTTILPGPADTGEAFEPSVAIDASNPDRILAAAMYGNPGGRGGRNIWAWQSEDGGKTWSSHRMRPLPIRGKESGWAADVIAGFTPDGASILTSMAGADKPRIDWIGGIVVSRREKGDTGFGAPVLIMRDSLNGGPDRVFVYDKPWMAIDRDPTSPHRGNIYVTSGILDMDMPIESWARTPVSLSRITMLGLDFSVSRDGGRSFGPVRRVADSVFGSDLAVGANGTLEIVHPKSVGTRSFILNLRSTDGGATFAAPDTVVTGDSATSVAGPMIASRPNGEVMACWSERNGAASRIRCAVRPPGASWTGRPIFGVTPPAGVRYAFPTAAGGTHGWYLLMHLVGADKTETVVFHGDGVKGFAQLATVATIPGLGEGQWCFDRDCRFGRDDLFMAGDYISLAATGGRLVAGYVLPRPGGALTGRAALYLSVLAEP